MKIEIHVLQNFGPSNLNRDDTGAPKDCELGGVRRARISSQCLKRAIREAFATSSLVSENLVSKEERAARTKRLVEHVAALVSEKNGVALEEVQSRVAVALGSAGLKAEADKGWKTQYLLFVPRRLINELAEIVAKNFDALAGKSETAASDDGNKLAKAKGKNAKAKAKEAVPAAVAKSVKELFANAQKTPELALFGRMIADAPEWNVEAACQVAHAVSTHRVSMEFDFYTAIDDLKKDDTAGSDMMGTIAFNSACFYRYLVVDTEALAKNLGGDAAAVDQAKRTVDALLRAAVLAIPSGKQNSMAAHNLPSIVLVDVRDGAAPRSLANAFVEPIRSHAGDGGDLVTQSIHVLGQHFATLDRVYGKETRKDHSFIVVGKTDKVGSAFAMQTGATDRGSLEELIAKSVEAAFKAAS